MSEEEGLIIKMYENGISQIKIYKFVQKDRRIIRSILIKNNIRLNDNKLFKKIIFSDKEKENIKNLYINENQSSYKIGLLYNVSKGTILGILREFNVLRKGKSNGIKIHLTNNQKKLIEKLYIDEKKVPKIISNILNIPWYIIHTYLKSINKIRSSSEANTIAKMGVKHSEAAIKNMRLAQQKYARSGKKKQSPGKCKIYIINELKCIGTYEKYYIEYLIKEGKKLPINCKSINTPFGVYFPDFEFPDKLIEIKSSYTYDILIGKRKDYWNSGRVRQLDKIKWINDNIKPIDILVVDKQHNLIKKKEIEKNGIGINRN